MYLLKVIKLMEIGQSSYRVFSQFSWETVKFGTFVFNKVVRWHEWGEMGKVCIAYMYNSNHFCIYLPKIIKIDGNLTKFWHKKFVQFFLDTVYICASMCAYIWLSVRVFACVATYTCVRMAACIWANGCTMKPIVLSMCRMLVSAAT